jgi:hypothetical protein
MAIATKRFSLQDDYADLGITDINTLQDTLLRNNPALELKIPDIAVRSYGQSCY